MRVYCRSCNKELEVVDKSKEYWMDYNGNYHIKIDCDVLEETK